jgi:hypothetical protein|tara:strand:- start:459 stop:875 length:417 start_codon:yes stop_codon:yes gene_type:complete
MIEKFGNIIYLIIYIVHFGIIGTYGYQLVFDTQKFIKGRGVDKSATLLTRFGGSFMIASVIMAIYVAFIRSGGLEATWAFFNFIFIINLCILITNFYSIKINKTGVNKKTGTDGIYAPLILTILSAIMCYGLADKIYV